VTPVLAYLLSVVGSLLGLTATARAQQTADPRRRARWLILAAWAIGGTGIWVMHFMAMIGFSVDGSPVLFSVPITIASWLLAVIVVGIGLFIVGYGRTSRFRVIAGGIFTGLGVASMHYSGMGAMRMNGATSYDTLRVVLSFVIAIVAATVALWFALVVRKVAWMVAAAALMGVAVTGMHYTGMSALSVRLFNGRNHISGVQGLSFLVPILVFVLLVVVALFYAILANPSQQDQAVEAALRDRIAAGPPLPAPPVSTFTPRRR
jgi:NO-binding membrane sensor protein with MHYT domain